MLEYIDTSDTLNVIGPGVQIHYFNEGGYYVISKFFE